jgi:ATP adenylyltransferase
MVGCEAANVAVVVVAVVVEALDCVADWSESEEQLVVRPSVRNPMTTIRTVDTSSDPGTTVDPGVGYSVHWAGWRTEFFEEWANRSTTLPNGCPFCGYIASGASDQDALIVRRTDSCMVILNRFPYVSGHVLIMPLRHVGELNQLTEPEASEIWQLCREAEQTLRHVFGATGVNIGFNLSASAGAAIPGHLHAHVLPRWVGDSNFTVAIANIRVIPEALAATRQRIADGWQTINAS